MIFVETRVFSRQRREQLEEEQFRSLQNNLLQNPHAGARIPAPVGSGSCGGARKVEASAAVFASSISWSMHAILSCCCSSIRRNVQDDLSAEQKGVLRELARAELEQEGEP
jgi:hypothetical protein